MIGKRKPPWSVLALNGLRSPWLVIVSTMLGLYIGVFQQQLATMIAPLGNLYLALLKMCVLPILLSAITLSIGRLMTKQDAARYVKRILIVFPIGLLLASTIGVIIGTIAGPGKNLNTSTLKTLGVLVNKSAIDLEISLSGSTPPAKETPGLTSFIFNMIPDNIFSALSEGQALKVLFFAVIFGATLGLVQGRSVGIVFDVLDSIYLAFRKIISGLTLLLPFGLCSLLASQIAKAGLTIVFSMLNFVVITIVTFALIYIINTLMVWQRAKCSLLDVLSALKEPTILALATSSSLSCLPSSISALSESLKFERQTTNLVVPLAITICRFGSVIYFALASLFVAQLYKTELGLGSLGIIIIASIFAGMATSGATGIVTLTMLNLVLQPLGLPLEAVLVLFIAIDPIVDPIRTLGIVHTGIAATAVIADLETDRQAVAPVASAQ